ncbi:MAG: rhodanese-like domain-containing protein [Crocinitomicaceae bacterium]|nr:rhodanese-like domain-containing protein [Crocinitomicaceae bacterium]
MKKAFKYLFIGLLISCANDSEDCKDCEVESTDTSTTEVVETEIEEVKRFTYDVDKEAFMDKLAETGGMLVDVRTPEEYENGFIEGAININFNGPDFEAEIDKLDTSTPTFVYCMAGGRSSNAMKKMNEMGFEEVYNLLGGYSGYAGTEASH